jgi:hypothetical protein
VLLFFGLLIAAVFILKSQNPALLDSLVKAGAGFVSWVFGLFKKR